MRDVLHFLEQYGYILVFANVLMEQLGLPLPAAPILLAAGALAGSGALSAIATVALASVASVLADNVWFLLGRRKGSSILNLLCRISLEPESCVNETKGLFHRLGSSALVVAKFVPGLSTVAPPLAAITRMPRWRFTLLDLAGSVLWSGVFVALGYVFSSQLERVAESVARFGSVTALIVGALIGLYVGFKYWQRRRFIHSLRTMRISPDELHDLIQAGCAPSVIDLRHFTELQSGAMRIPGAVWFERADLERRHQEIPRDRDVILYCS